MVAEVPSDVMNSTDTCLYATGRHHERPSQGSCQSGRGKATRQQWSHLAAQPAEEGSPGRGYQSPPQSSSKPPDSAERYEWLSAAMRRAGRLAMRRPCAEVRWPAGPSPLACCRPPSRCASSGRCQPASGSSPEPVPSPAHRQPTSTTAPTWMPSSAPPSPSAMSMAGCLAGVARERTSH